MPYPGVVMGSQRLVLQHQVRSPVTARYHTLPDWNFAVNRFPNHSRANVPAAFCFRQTLHRLIQCKLGEPVPFVTPMGFSEVLREHQFFDDAPGNKVT